MSTAITFARASVARFIWAERRTRLPSEIVMNRAVNFADRTATAMAQDGKAELSDAYAAVTSWLSASRDRLNARRAPAVLAALDPSTTAPQDHGPLAAHLSDRTLAKVRSRPAHVPRETPSLVEMDQRDEVRSLLAGAIWISTGGVGNLYDFGHTYAVDPFLAADAILARFEVKAVQS